MSPFVSPCPPQRLDGPDLGEVQACILLFDDRPENLVAFEAVLEPLGHQLLRAASGEEALKQLLRHDVALIVLDVEMPGMSGFETAARIKERQRTQDIPIIFLTAHSTDGGRRRQRAPGVLPSNTYRSTTVPVEPGTLLLQFTDGLVESPTLALQDGLAGLLAAVWGRRRPGPSGLAGFCEALVADLVPDETGDDIALLAALVE